LRGPGFRYALGWEDAGAETLKSADAIDSTQLSAKTAKAKRQSKAAARNEKAVVGFPLRVSAARSIVMGKDFDKDTAPQTQNFVAATAEEAQEWAEVINQALESLAHDNMSAMPNGTSNAARAVKLLAIQAGLSGQANAPKVAVSHA
jgi:hypothetical protein